MTEREKPKTRRIQGRRYRVKIIPAENPDAVRERDGIPPEPVGTKPMTNMHDSDHNEAVGRRAPKNQQT